MKNNFLPNERLLFMLEWRNKKFFEKNKEFLLNNHMNVINKQPITA